MATRGKSTRARGMVRKTRARPDVYKRQVRRDFGKIRFGGFDGVMGKAEGASGFGGGFTVQRGEEPGFDFGGVGELVSALGPSEKGLLDEIAGIGFISGQAAREAVHRLVVFEHEAFEIHVATHAADDY